MSLGDAEDRADIERVLAGETGAFAGLVERWQGPLLQLAFRYTRDRGQAEDLVQEVFLLVFRKLHSFRGTARFSTWLFSVATRLCISHVRRHGPPPTLADEPDSRSRWQNLADLVETRDEAERVRDAVTRLPPKHRDALILYYFRGEDVREAADILGIPEVTLKARLHRGREELRRHLGRVRGVGAARPRAKENG